MAKKAPAKTGTISGRFSKFTADHNLMAAEDMDTLLFEPFMLALGEDTVERLQIQFDNYEYYSGKQHRNDNGELVFAEDLERPVGMDYDPTRYATNYFKAIINRKARWQMGGKHSIRVPRPTIDPSLDQLEPGYEPSSQQLTANEIADGYEKLLYRLWRENKMRSSLVQAARDRLIADRVVCKIVFNPATGKLRWLWRPDTEFIPIFSDDDFEDLVGCHFVRQKVVEIDGEDANAFQLQTYRMEGEGESRMCHIEEAVYLAEDLSLHQQITPKTSMELPFMPIVVVPVSDLIAEFNGESEVSDLRVQNDVLNRMNEDAIDSLKFEMFSMTAVLNAPEGTAARMQIAPGAVVEARGHTDSATPDIKKVEGGFRWKDAFKDQYMRVKAAMHETSSLPQVVPQEMNFGGLNSETLQILFHDIITDTEEHWLTWGLALEELHEKSIKYLQARLSEPMFAYDKDVVRKIEVYESEVTFALPLPDNRKDLVELLSLEMISKVESQAGAMERLGVEDVRAKKKEIQNEQVEAVTLLDPYAEEPGSENLFPDDNKPSDKEALIEEQGKKRNANGEVVETCPVCGGSGRVSSVKDGSEVICPNCKGDGVVQRRKR